MPETIVTLVCETCGPDNCPPYAALALGEGLARDLLALRDRVRPLWEADHARFYGACYYNSACRFGGSAALAGLAADGDPVIEPGDWFLLENGIPDDWEGERTAADRLVVKDDGVLWTAYPKHGGSPSDFESETVPWAWVEAVAAGRTPDVTPAGVPVPEEDDDDEEEED